MWALFALYQLLSSRKPAVARTQVAPVVNPLLLLSATQLAKKIRRKEVRNRSGGAARTQQRDKEAVEESVALKLDITVLIMFYSDCVGEWGQELGQIRFFSVMFRFGCTKTCLCSNKLKLNQEENSMYICH